jgi:hypothetical protein
MTTPIAEPFQMIHGLYTSKLVFHLHTVGALEQFANGSAAGAVANRFGYDRTVFESVIDYICRTTGMLTFEPPDIYRLTGAGGSYAQFGFHLDKFMGAYGPLIERLEETLSNPQNGQRLVDRRALAHAFRRAETLIPGQVSGLVREWNVKSLLDLGCGVGTLLRELCRADPGFRAWGIDRDPFMCQIAIEELASAGLSDRVRICCGDVWTIDSVLASRERDSIEALHGNSILNEFFGEGSGQVVEFLRRLGESFPGRLLFVVDYYGSLSQRCAGTDRYHSLLQDVVQALSGQGLPPADLQGWVSIYEAAGCSLLHVFHGSSTGLDWFVHIVRVS